MAALTVVGLVVAGSGAAAAGGGGGTPAEYVEDHPLSFVYGNHNELSGIAVADDGDVFAVDDNGKFVALAKKYGYWFSKPLWDPWQQLHGRDVEGLTWIGGDQFAVAFELDGGNSSRSAMQVFELREFWSFQYIRPVSSRIALPAIDASGNTGLQGIVFAPEESDNNTYVFYGVEEAAPILWRIAYDVASRTATTGPGAPLAATTSLAGIAIPPADSGGAFVLSDGTKEVKKFDLPSGAEDTAAGTLDLSNFFDPEGLAFDGTTLYVIGEGSQIATYTPTMVPDVAALEIDDIQLNGIAAGSAPGPELIEGSATLTFTVENTGNTALSGLTTTPASSCTGVLPVGQSQTCTATVTITNPAQSPVPIFASGTGAGQTATDQGSYHYEVPTADIALGNIELNGLAAGSVPGPALPQGFATLTFTVENTGGVDLTSVGTTPATICPGSIPVGGTISCSATVPITNPSEPPVPILVTGSGGGQTVTDQGTYNYEVLVADIELGNITLNGVPAGSAPGPELPAGPATLTFSIENTGGVPLTVAQLAPAFNCLFALVPGETQTCSGTVTIVDPAVSPVDVGVTAEAGPIVVGDNGQYHYTSPDPDPVGAVVINEVETEGSPSDWIELYNPEANPIDLTGYYLTDNNPGGNGNRLNIPAGTTLAGGAFLVFETRGPLSDFGLGGSDSAVLRDPQNAIVSSYTWTSHSPTSYGLCPDGVLPYKVTSVETRGGANNCDTGTTQDWNGPDDVDLVDVAQTFPVGDLSGLDYEAPGVLWAAIDGGEIYRLTQNAAGQWQRDPSGGWANGKTIRYTAANPLGVVDAEGVTFTSDSSELYVASERDNRSGQDTTSLNTVLRYEPNAASPIVASEVWDLTFNPANPGDVDRLPPTGPNAGLEAITWVPDNFLAQAGFFDEAANAAYNPANYDAHSGGVFFVGVEDLVGAENVFAYVLEDDGDFRKIATVTSGLNRVMALEFDIDTGDLWVHCDSACNNEASVLTLTNGAFTRDVTYSPPTQLGAGGNNEGFALAPAAECGGANPVSRPVFWGEDDDPNVPALREGRTARGC